MLLTLAGMFAAAATVRAAPPPDAIAQDLVLPAGLPERLVLPVRLDDGVHELVLHRRTLRSPAFRVRTQESAGVVRPVSAPAARTFAGHLAGDPASAAAATLLPPERGGGIVAAIIRADGTRWHVEPRRDEPPPAHVAFRAGDVEPPDGTCLLAALPGATTASAAASAPAPPPASGPRVIRIAFDADFEYFTLNGSSVGATVLDIELIMNIVDVIYDFHVDVTFEITDVLVRTHVKDPYASDFPVQLLFDFGEHWNTTQCTVERDIAHLMTGRELFGSPIGVAWPGVACTRPDRAYGLSQTRSSIEFVERVALTAHEIGHNLGALHCNGATDCAIMCSGLGGCSGELTTFGATAAAEMLAHLAGVACADPAADCDGSGTNDRCDVAAGSPDCDANGVPDGCDVASGAASDCNGNGIPDACETATDIFAISALLTPIGDGFPQAYTFTGLPPANGDVTLEFQATADLGSSTELIDVALGGMPLGTIYADDGADCSGVPVRTELLVPAATFNAARDAGGSVTVELVPSLAVSPMTCGGTSLIWIEVDYIATPANDADGDGVPDDCRAACPGDLDGDEATGFTDLATMLAAWGPCPETPECPADLDGDDVVAFTDLTTLLGAWGPCP